MKCKNCNTELVDVYIFCPQCGIPLKEDSPEYLLRKVIEFRRMGKMREALKHCKIVSEKLNDPYIYKLVGDFAYLTGEIELAIRNQEKSLELMPDFPDSIYALGISYFRMGKIQKAIQYFNECITKNPDFSMAYYWLGHSYYYTGDIDKAIENFLKLIEHSPESKIAHYHLGISYHSKGDEEKALMHFKILEDLGAEYPSLFFHIGNVCFLLHNIPEAIKYLKKALEMNPEEERARKLLTRICEPPHI